MLERKQGWLTAGFFCRFRELLTHTMFRYGLACPVFCLMPDHMHLIWMGFCEGSDQLNAMKHFRTNCNESLQNDGFELQDQAYDHVLKADERREAEFRCTSEYILRNPERAGPIEPDGYGSWPFSGCLLPGYPGLSPFQPDYWDQFDRIISFLRNQRLQRT